MGSDCIVPLKADTSSGLQLCLSPEEFEELVHSFNQQASLGGGLQDPEVKKYLYEVTSGVVRLHMAHSVCAIFARVHLITHQHASNLFCSIHTPVVP